MLYTCTFCVIFCGLRFSHVLMTVVHATGPCSACVLAQACPTMSYIHAVLLFQCFTRHGCCSVKITDQGREFVLSGSAAASGHLENKQDTVMMYLLPLAVSGRGPTKSTPIVSHTLSFTGIGWSSAVNLSNFLLGEIDMN